MIDALHHSTTRLQKAYSRRSKAYSKLVAPAERGYHHRALDLAAIRPTDAMLEVAVGPGHTLLELARLAAPGNVVHGVDLSPGMLALARSYLESAGFNNVILKTGSALQLDYPDGSFDVLYNGYMLDLIPFDQMPVVLSEFRRVLKPGGKLVLLNMSKETADTHTLRETLYQKLPPGIVLYLMGSCRPVLMEEPVREAGFREVERHFLSGPMPSEVVLALK